jgi:hypothetical protein
MASAMLMMQLFYDITCDIKNETKIKGWCNFSFAFYKQNFRDFLRTFYQKKLFLSKQTFFT